MLNRRIDTLIPRALLLACSSLSALSAYAEDEPWRNPDTPPSERAEQLLAAMSQEEKIALVLASEDHEYAALEHLGLPLLRRVDASAGLRGDTGVTAFPAPIALGATFNPELGNAMGEAIAQEARLKGWNVILGPTVDLARDPLFGRIAESYGEDPLISGQIGAKVVEGMQSQDVLTMVKHFNVYHQETDRLFVDIQVSERALRELYQLPFDLMLENDAPASIMGSYPKINGTFACENEELISSLKEDDRFTGFFATDYAAGAQLSIGRPANLVEQFNAGIDSWSLQPSFYKPTDPFTDGSIPEARLDDAAKRILSPIFKYNLFDNPLPNRVAANATNDEHQELAKQIAIEGSVLLKNSDSTLPLSQQKSIAVIGPASTDMITGIQGSSYVDPGQFTTALNAISNSVSEPSLVVHEQGSLGDSPLPVIGVPSFPFVEPNPLSTPSGEPGLKLEIFDNPEFAGKPVYTRVETEIRLEQAPLADLPREWAARWTGTVTSPQGGLTRFNATLSGTVRLKIGDQTIISGSRAAKDFFAGHGGHYRYPIDGTAYLEAGQPTPISVEYTTSKGLWGNSISIGWQAMSLIPAAVEIAKSSDVAVVFVNQVSGEEMDRLNLELPGDQNQLVHAVAAANPNTIVVVNTPGAISMPWIDDVKAVLHVWQPGAAAGTALADILFGKVDPGGRLPITFPQSLEQGPALYDGGGSISYDEGVFIGYSYFKQHQQKPLFPFGHGLSYTSFEYSDLKITSHSKTPSLTLTLTNTGERAGSTVPQVYVDEREVDGIAIPYRLAGFKKVHLAAGESKQVSIDLEPKTLSYWDSDSSTWILPKGDVTLSVGESSAEIVLSGVLNIR
ncbi:beta-glucosidase [Pelagicoccus albus]|uniref:Glycoside hydrolase family 3 C-terminal domain-containing protein n=1 Tax=Pelagicoccus albus TaxID=415222 RepID=A0A7X1B7T9_9BACT|nr:glycoside hydrolase family 3 C-terminal domain-containing protein [Pelagicoccus albus]MBC2607274.1 glycoside hydrolase family 3 C-terminal domain-containing protein [Pelagicoccus albus]